MLTSNISKSNVLLKHNCDTRAEVIALLADSLFASGKVKASFKQAVLEREESFATGLESGEICVAIPHTDREHVISDSIAVMTLNSPVGFNAMGTDDVPVSVRIVFMLAISSNDKQIDTLQEVIDVVQDQELLSKLLCASDYQEFVDYLNAIEVID
ncbi:PTS sugar transporter subunit IIA [Vibrio panuliri]|uniref:PTS EIIA type-2 domain-containing protein n=1 Tax=Vibrio panuliri TaxID=1381081 RepID=A0ABX3FQT5_9VIBR|nr:PTS sugar transporter subunit IIA [Vibrio panuliri]OLQ96605.1 hypothetical protein BIY20_18485 [Vibrio panuliri]